MQNIKNYSSPGTYMYDWNVSLQRDITVRLDISTYHTLAYFEKSKSFQFFINV